MSTAFDAWHARAMALMEELADAAKDYGRDSEELRHLNSYGAVDGLPLNAARAALAAHLAELPMGEPVGHMQYAARGFERGFRSGHLTDEDREYATLDGDRLVPLYRHPKDTA